MFGNTLKAIDFGNKDYPIISVLIASYSIRNDKIQVSLV